MRLISTPEVALLLGISDNAVRLLASRGHFVRYGPRNRRQYDLAQVVAYREKWRQYAKELGVAS